MGTIQMLISNTLIRVFSSVGLERYLDRVEVGGSNPSTPTRLDVNVEPFLTPYFELFSNFSTF